MVDKGQSELVGHAAMLRAFKVFKVQPGLRPGLFLAVVVALAMLAVPSSVFARGGGGIVSLSHETGGPGSTVTVTFSFINTGEVTVLEARARIQGIEAFSVVDASQMCSGSTAGITFCVMNDTNRLVYLVMSSTPGDLIADFTGTIRLTIAEDATPGSTIPLEWHAPDDEGLTFTPEQAFDGSIQIPETFPLISVEPEALIFGEVSVGEGAEQQSVTVSNSGSDDGLEITDIEVSNEDFVVVDSDCAGAVVDQDASCSIDIAFWPSQNGAVAGQLIIDSNAGPAYVDLAGTGLAPSLEIDPAPGTVDLGPVEPGEADSIAAHMTNVGSEPLDVSCELADENSPFQSDPSPLQFEGIEPDDQVDFAVTYTAPDELSHTALLECTSNSDNLPFFEYQLEATGTQIHADRFENEDSR